MNGTNHKIGSNPMLSQSHCEAAAIQCVPIDNVLKQSHGDMGLTRDPKYRSQVPKV